MNLSLLRKLSPREGIVIALVIAALDSAMQNQDGKSGLLSPRRKDPEGWVYAKQEVVRDFVCREPMVRMRVSQAEIEFALYRLADGRGLNILDDVIIHAVLPMVCLSRSCTSPIAPANLGENLYQILSKSGWAKGDAKDQAKKILALLK